MEEKQILITGAAGLIGSAVVRHLNDQGQTNLILVDHLGTSENWKNLVSKKFSDLLDREQLFDWLSQHPGVLKAVIHLGACSSTVEKDASYLLENNYRFTRRLASFALEHGLRFIYASSAATYGDGSRGFSDDHASVPELRPLNMYGYSKQLFDQWALREGVLDKIVGLKYFNVFGPNEWHKERMASAVLHFHRQILDEGTVRLFQSSAPSDFGDGEQCRDFIYVKDAARMTCAFLENTAGGLFNIGSGEPNTWNTLAKGVFAGLGKEAVISYIPMPGDLVGKYQNFTCADMNKTRSCLGADALTTPFKMAVKEYVQMHLSTGERW